jgi:uncharacterized protein
MAEDADKTSRPRRKANCPICKAPTAERWRPFCSSRCADVDLARWLGGQYAIPGGDADADEDGDDTRAQHAGRDFDRQMSDPDDGSRG